MPTAYLVSSILPDTGKVEGKEFDLSATVVAGFGGSVSGSVGYGQTNGSKNWIEEQTRITAKDKVDIRTENHTQLDGALIASDSGNLKLDTNTLGYSDIAGKDKEHGYYLNVGGSYGTSGSTTQDSTQVGKGDDQKNGWSVEGWNYNKDREQIVRGTVGAGDVVVRSDTAGKDSTAGLNRDVDKAYEITRDDEHRTDLYVTKSSLEAVADPSGTVNAWKTAIQSYPGKTVDLLNAASTLLAGTVSSAEQVWKNIQAQSVSINDVPDSVREQFGDELALNLTKAFVQNGRNVEDINKLSQDDIAVIQSFSSRFSEFNVQQAACNAAGGCSDGFNADADPIHYKDKDGVNKMVWLQDANSDTPGGKLLEQAERLQCYLDKLPVEQAELLGLGVQTVMGPAKMALGMAGSIVLNKLFGDKIAAAKDAMAKTVASDLSGKDRDDLVSSDNKLKELYDVDANAQKGDVYVRGATTLINIALGTAVASTGVAGAAIIKGVGTGSSVAASRPIDPVKVTIDANWNKASRPIKTPDAAPQAVAGATKASDQTALPSYYREDSSAGASFNKTGGLPEGYRRVVNTRTGNVEVVGPDGSLYFEVAGGGLKPKAGGNLAALVKAERDIDGAKGVPSIADSGASSAANAARLKMQMVAEQAAGARAPTQITSYSNHALEQFAGRDGGIGVSESALSGAWSSPLKIEYVPSKYGPTFRYTERMQSSWSILKVKS